MIFTTSGTTGTPKRFSLTKAQLAARAESRGNAKGPGIVRCRSLYCGLASSSTAFAAWRLWAKRKGVHFYYGSTYSERLFGDHGIDGIVASSGSLAGFVNQISGHTFHLVLASGTRTSPSIAARLRALSVDRIVYFSYGASEVGSIALATGDEVERIHGCVGRPCPGVEISIEDSEVLVKTPTMIDGYDDPALTAAAFVDGWFRTGDLGRMTGDGLLVLSRRQRG